MSPAPTDTATAGHGYFYGTGDHPDFAVVVAIVDERVHYLIPAHEEPTLRSTSRTAFQLRADAGARPVRARAAACEGPARPAAYMDEDDVEHVRKCLREYAQRHGAPVDFADLDRLRVTVTGPKELDVYGIAKSWGVAAGWDTDQWTTEVECTREAMKGMQADGLTVALVKVLWACPTGV